MSEVLQFPKKYEQEALEGMELVDLVESMSYYERIAYKNKLLSEMSDRETLVHLINEVNEVEGQIDG